MCCGWWAVGDVLCAVDDTLCAMGDILCALRSTLWSGSLGHHMNSFTHRCRNPKLKNPDVTVIMLASHHIRKSRMQSSITYLAKAWSQGNNAIVDGAGVVFVSALWWSRDEKSRANKWTNVSGANIKWSDDRMFPSQLRKCFMNYFWSNIDGLNIIWINLKHG